jgi:hypothetical protein
MCPFFACVVLELFSIIDHQYESARLCAQLSIAQQGCDKESNMCRINDVVIRAWWSAASEPNLLVGGNLVRGRLVLSEAQLVCAAVVVPWVVNAMWKDNGVAGKKYCQRTWRRWKEWYKTVRTRVLISFSHNLSPHVILRL